MITEAGEIAATLHSAGPGAMADACHKKQDAGQLGISPSRRQRRCPRMLRLTFEFHIAPGLKADVRSKRVRDAAARLTAAVQALAATAFPWAERLVVTKEYSYRWMAGEEKIKLPATSENTKSR